MPVLSSKWQRNLFSRIFVIKTEGGAKLTHMGQLTIAQQDGLLELDGLLLHTEDDIEILLLGSWVPGAVSHDERGWYLATREGTGIRLQTGLPARLLSLSSEARPWPNTFHFF